MIVIANPNNEFCRASLVGERLDTFGHGITESWLIVRDPSESSVVPLVVEHQGLLFGL